ncbi:hypothetical protein EDD16DRAFT_1620950 [Pisolithus croceorrhizus]|nr:hypothetical protein EDD16DRAFT_1620950 [Pisolithus croceorrhizus]KAI6166430.1 hypothetical protein EDD17DRAFT_1548318 [Pisolithus thermaeus]
MARVVYHRGTPGVQKLLFFTPSTVAKKKRWHAVKSLFILRNPVVNEPNIYELANSPRTRPLLLCTLTNLDLNAKI